jgi:anti-anti-sigma factor
MITDCRTEECTVVQVSGELDIATAPQLHDHLSAFIRDGHRIVLDLAEVEFMDSSGLEVLLSCHRSAGLCGTALVLRSPSPRVSRLLELSGLASHFLIEKDLQVEEKQLPVPRAR